MTTTSYIDPRELEAIGGMKLRARAVVEGVMAGLHRNPHRGASVEFAEYKEYAAGDELKHIDWRAYARVDRYYVKQFEDETNVRAFLLLDTSNSMNFGFDGVPTKFSYAASLLASLAWLLLQQGDAPGLLLFNDAPRTFLPPTSKRTQLDDICTVLDQARVGGATRLDSALSRIAESIRARSLVVIASDMIDANDDALKLARVLRARGMEVAVFHIMDRAEWTLPWEDMTLFEGLEGEGDVLAEPDELRSAYQNDVQEMLDRLQAECVRGDIEYFHVFSDTPIEAALLRLLNGRRSRGGRR